jgi:hypothetical protein
MAQIRWARGLWPPGGCSMQFPPKIKNIGRLNSSHTKNRVILQITSLCPAPPRADSTAATSPLISDWIFHCWRRHYLPRRSRHRGALSTCASTYHKMSSPPRTKRTRAGAADDDRVGSSVSGAASPVPSLDHLLYSNLISRKAEVDMGCLKSQAHGLNNKAAPLFLVVPHK